MTTWIVATAVLYVLGMGTFPGFVRWISKLLEETDLNEDIPVLALINWPVFVLIGYIWLVSAAIKRTYKEAGQRREQ